jgi:hypothetical protein
MLDQVELGKNKLLKKNKTLLSENGRVTYIRDVHLF